MFQSLSDRLSGVLDKLTASRCADRERRRRGDARSAPRAARSRRRARCGADFIDKVKAKAVGAGGRCARSRPARWSSRSSTTSWSPCSAPTPSPSTSHAAPPVGILMVGLQGSGKTTTTAKIAYRLTNRDKKKVLMASLDTRRPAAQEQLRVLGEQTGVDDAADRRRPDAACRSRAARDGCRAPRRLRRRASSTPPAASRSTKS